MAKTTTQNAFTNGDFAKLADYSQLAEQFKLPSIDGEALIASQRKTFETFTKANRVAFEGVQSLFQRQAEIVRDGFQEAAKAAQELTAASTAEAKLEKQADLTKRAYEVALANFSELSGLVTKSNTEAAALINKRVAESIEEYKAALKKAAA
ncbi:MAG: phasin family protein [Kiloniellales bacterium]